MTDSQFRIFWKTTVILGTFVFLMYLVRAMNREGFEERFGYDAERMPEFGMSDREVEEHRFQMMMNLYGSTHHHH
jgi:hypothetical protein